MNSRIKLSPYHTSLYYQWQLCPKNSKYNIVVDQSLELNLDIARLSDCLIRFVNSYLLFNSHIVEDDQELYWVENTQINKLEYFDYANKHQIYKYISKPFHLNTEPLYRFAIFKYYNYYRFIIVMHHLLIDGASRKFFYAEISNYYNDLNYKSFASIDEQKQKIVEANKQVNRLLSDNYEKLLDVWQKLLATTEATDIRFLRNSKELSSKSCNNLIKELRFSFNEDICLQLRQLQIKHKISAYFYGQMVLAMLIFKYTGRSNFAIAYPVAIKEYMHLIFGVGINTNVFPYEINQQATVVDIIQYVLNITQMIKDNKASYLPISKILLSTDNKGILDVFFSQTCLKDTQFNFYNTATLEVNHTFNVDLDSKLLFEQEQTKISLNYRVRYDKNIVSSLLIKYFVKYYRRMFIEILSDLLQNNLTKTISEYSLLSLKEYKKIVYQFNNKNLTIRNDTIHQLFEDQVTKTPHNIAIYYNKRTLTYYQLNQCANRIAWYIYINCRISIGDLIALYVEKSEYLPIAILATLKSGGAYIPLEINYPVNRMEYILKDTLPKVILTQKKYKGRISGFLKCPIIEIDNFGDVSDKEHIENLNLTVAPNSLAYIIYTSGTTGYPKGVLQTHLNVVQLFNITSTVYDFNSKDVWLLFHSYVFDFSVWEMWGALFYGGTLLIPNKFEIKDFGRLHALCMAKRVTVLNQTPSAFYQFAHIAVKREYLADLRYIIFGGEALNMQQLKMWYSFYKGKGPQLVNMYGITETTVHTTYKLIHSCSLYKNSLIGNVLPDQKFYVLDQELQAVPFGAIGELYLGGARLANGYINQPLITKKHFLPNPYQTKNEFINGINNLIYKTGDLVRLLPNRELEYIGRNDRQVKIRGFRIELNEIEATISSHEQIQYSVVLVREIKVGREIANKLIVAYYQSANEIDNQLIVAWLSTRLPRYMIPDIFIRVSKIPLTINGKLDINALPNYQDMLENISYKPPSSDKERFICKAFSEALGLPYQCIGVDQDFFKLGGNSLLAIKLITQLRDKFIITVNDVFVLKTPAKIAKCIQENDSINLKQQIKRIELLYLNSACKAIDVENAKIKKHQYLLSIKDHDFANDLKPISNVLLTGSTGYLGCHVLYQILLFTNFNIHLPIRAISIRIAEKKIFEIFKFYFDLDLTVYKNRLFIFPADIEKSLDVNQFPIEVDSVIHTAALTKHYGLYEEFYSKNVQATINMLDFTLRTKSRDFHYISTISVLLHGFIPNCTYQIFHEDDDNILQGQDNFYLRTKSKAEQIVVSYREYGINSSIYRVGNLAINSQTFKFPKNCHENAFLNKLRIVRMLGMICPEISEVEISPVDCVSLAITKIFSHKNLNNQVYHLFNPTKCNLIDIVGLHGKKKIKVVPLKEFIYHVLRYLEYNPDDELIKLFMLHQLWLQNVDCNQVTKIELQNDKTEFVLRKLGVRWTQIDYSKLSKFT